MGLEDLQSVSMGLEDPSWESMGLEDLQWVWRTSKHYLWVWRTSNGSGGLRLGIYGSGGPQLGIYGSEALQAPLPPPYFPSLPPVCRSESLPPSAPEVQVLHGSSCSASGGDSVELLCLVSGFYPAQIDLEWLVDGIRGLLEASVSPPVREGNAYSLSSRLNVSKEDWKEGKSFTCRVKHPATATVVEDHARACSGWGAKGGKWGEMVVWGSFATPFLPHFLPFLPHFLSFCPISSLSAPIFPPFLPHFPHFLPPISLCLPLQA